MMLTVPSALTPLKRTTWKPQVKHGDGRLYESKFAGTPWLASNESWPTCQHCDKPMPLFLQLNLDTIPETLHGEFGSGLLQLFYCTSTDPYCEVENEAFFPFTSGKLARVLIPEGEPHHIERPEAARIFPPRRIIDWQAEEDYPNWEESLEYGVKLSEKEWDRLSEEGLPRNGDKLAGWPLWIQGVEYPACPICHERMRFIFQIDSDDHLPYMFGDLGCGQITQCPIHITQVAFAWACS